MVLLESFFTWLIVDLFNISIDSHFGQALHFFLYDSVKIIIMLFVMISLIGVIRTYIQPEKIKNWLCGKKLGLGNLGASLFGVLTPFCSCSSIPIFLGFLESGVPLGVAFSFLITSPLVNEYLAVLMFTFFGWKIACAYIFFGVLIGVSLGMLLQRLGLEKYLIRDITRPVKIRKKIVYKSIAMRVKKGFSSARFILKRLWPWILVGVGIGAFIHGFIPREFIESVVRKAGFLAIPAAVLVGVPMYGSCVTIVPIAIALFTKGVPLGTALAFMMATAALSLPEAIILKRAMKPKLLALFFGLVAIGIICVGYLFNIVAIFL